MCKILCVDSKSTYLPANLDNTTKTNTAIPAILNIVIIDACCCRSKTAVICRCPEVAAGDNATSAEVYAVMAPGC